MRNVLVVVLLALLGACARSPAVPVGAPPGEPVRIVLRGEGPEHSSLEADTRGERARHGVFAGTLGGTAAGGAAAVASAAALGAAAPITLLLLIPAGTVAGVVGGGLHGFSGLSKEVAERVNAVLGELDARRDLRADLVAALERELAPEFQVVSDCADCPRVTVSIVRFAVEQYRGKQLSLELKTEMRVERRDAGARDLAVHRFGNRSESGKNDVHKWLAAEGAALDEAVSGCLGDAARRMREDLRRAMQP